MTIAATLAGAAPLLGLFELGLAALLLIINGAISIVFGLGIGRALAIAAVRMVVQLLLVGTVLRFVFLQSSWPLTLLVALVMIGVAGFEVAHRQSPRILGWWTYGLGGATLLLVGGLATLYAVGGIVGSRPWYEPRTLLPILGMVLGNTLTGVSLALATVIDLARREARSIEARLALGATRWVAFGDVSRQALRTALLPTINAMSVAGVVTLPGMMTGQILAGADPELAARYQIMILLVIAGASGLGALAATFGGAWLLTDSRHRLRLDRLQR